MWQPAAISAMPVGSGLKLGASPNHGPFWTDKGQLRLLLETPSQAASISDAVQYLSFNQGEIMEINTILTQVGNELFTTVMKELAVVVVSTCSRGFD